MKSRRPAKFVAYTVVLAMISGCAVTPERFEKSKFSMSDTEVCKAVAAAEKSGDSNYIFATGQEQTRREVTDEGCAMLISADKKKTAIAGAAILGALVILAASRGGGGGAPQAQANDYDWDWDQFYNQYRQLVWACRGVQTGQFADNSRCQYKLQIDSHWPSKEAPR